jgi:septum formation protein
MTAVGWEFEKAVADVDETVLPNETAEDYVTRLALEKASVIASQKPESIVLGADTTVVVDGEIVGKPLDTDDARRMLRLLSGRRHEVLTGVALVLGGRNVVGLERTGVQFCELSDSEIEFLVAEGEPMDKAGAYAVQAQAALFITGIEGDYWNVVGLPISLVYKKMNEILSAAAG